MRKINFCFLFYNNNSNEYRQSDNKFSKRYV